jgi:hypothetical protein
MDQLTKSEMIAIILYAAELQRGSASLGLVELVNRIIEKYPELSLYDAPKLSDLPTK